MSKIRKVEISNFRSIQRLDWAPSPGINCLIGQGDAGKSTILDAIDLCLGARRSLQMSDVDFYRLDVSRPIDITITIGDLSDRLKNLDAFGDFLRGFDHHSKQLEDEPRAGLETVLTIKFSASSDLEPNWALYSDRAATQGIERGLAWKDRSEISPIRIGSYAATNLSWAKTSILNKLSEDRPDLGAELARAAREARTNFGTQAANQLNATIQIVSRTASDLGVPIGNAAQALLDAHSVSIGDGAISLHDASGIPLRSLGTGSTRLLVAGLQRAAAATASIALADEVEYGLEPHRLARFLDSVGARDPNHPLQVFMTTHSPVALRELNGGQLYVVRPGNEMHHVQVVGTANDIQGTVRSYPDAFLAKSILVCEGASEVGLARGLDQHWVSQGHRSFFAAGGAYIDAKGGHPDQCYQKGEALLRLGYRVMVLVDADKPATAACVNSFLGAGGTSLAWRTPRAIEDELFLSLNTGAIHALLSKAEQFVGQDLVNQHIVSASNGQSNLTMISGEGVTTGYSPNTRALLGKASRPQKNGWFKSISRFEEISREIVGPNLVDSEPGFAAIIDTLFRWTRAA